MILHLIIEGNIEKRWPAGQRQHSCADGLAEKEKEEEIAAFKRRSSLKRTPPPVRKAVVAQKVVERDRSFSDGSIEGTLLKKEEKRGKVRARSEDEEEATWSTLTKMIGNIIGGIKN